MQKLRLKLMLVMLLVCMTGFSKSQTVPTVNINLKNASLTGLFSTIEKQTTYHFSYRSEDIDSRHDITMKRNNAKVTTVLSEVLPSRNLSYKVVSANTIAVSKADPAPSNSKVQ